MRDIGHPARRGAAILAGAVALVLSLALVGRTEGKNPWESVIAGFEAQDRARPPATGGIVFVGSSSIRFWDTDKSFPGHGVLNRGFGGSHVSDSVHFAERIVIKYKPRLVVVYAGDNDLAAGKSPERIRDDFQAFTRKIHAALPDTKILFLSIKPSPARWKLLDKQRRANELVAKMAEGDPRLSFVDVGSVLLGADGQPKKEMFVADGLHLNDAGYRAWAAIVRPYFK